MERLWDRQRSLLAPRRPQDRVPGTRSHLKQRKTFQQARALQVEGVVEGEGGSLPEPQKSRREKTRGRNFRSGFLEPDFQP